MGGHEQGETTDVPVLRRPKHLGKQCGAAAVVAFADHNERRRLSTLVYLMTTLGIGLFVSTISSTQQQAMMTSMFFFMMPMMYLSGFVFPIENMPAIIQYVTYLIPLRYFLVILRSVFLKGVGFETLWP